MTSDRINLRIAVACGLDQEDAQAQYRDDSLVDYTTDLNAMHEAEISLDQDHLVEYIELLSDILNDDCRIGLAICATAAQRAEAFCRTVKCLKCGKTIWDCEQTECKGGV